MKRNSHETASVGRIEKETRLKLMPPRSQPLAECGTPEKTESLSAEKMQERNTGSKTGDGPKHYDEEKRLANRDRGGTGSPINGARPNNKVKKEYQQER